MNYAEFTKLILNKYGIEAQRPWIKYPDYAVFRHGDNKKWFALLMRIPKCRLTGKDTDEIDVINLKCDPELASWLISQPGIFPAYHMNKEKWISVMLDHPDVQDKIEGLLQISFELTALKCSKRKKLKE